MKLKLIIINLLSVVLLSSCLENTSNNNAGTPKPVINNQNLATALTISNVGTVPQVGSAGTNSLVYVHNHSTEEIKNISYNVRYITDNLSFKLEPASIGLCSNINAGQSCPLTFSGLLSSAVSGGSAIIEVSYNLNKEHKQFSQLINFTQIDANNQSTMTFGSGLNISGYGNSTGYGVVYLVNTNSQNKSSEIKSIKADKPGVKITQGNVSQEDMPTGFVQAVEISSPTFNQGINANLIVDSLNADQLDKTTTSIYIEKSTTGAVLTTGPSATINTLFMSKGSLMLFNRGTGTATLGNIEYPQGTIADSGVGACATGSVLQANQGCMVHFKINTDNGNGNIKVSYIGGETTAVYQNIAWYNPNTGALLGMHVSPNPISIAETQSEKVNITVTNNSNAAVTLGDVSAPKTLTGGTTGSVASNGCQKGKTLNRGDVCSYIVNITSGSVERNKQLELGVSGSYANGVAYRRSAILNYNTHSYVAAVSTSLPRTMTISGNNIASDMQTMTLYNNGNAPAAINHRLLNNPAFLRMEPTSENPCTGKLEAGATCTIGFRLTPIASLSNIESVADFRISYSGGTTPPTETNYEISYVVTSSNIALPMENPIVNGANSEGVGMQGNPLIYSGGTPSSAQHVTFVYKNTGAMEFTIDTIIDSIHTNQIAWMLDLGNSSCNKKFLKLNESCTIRYQNIFANNANRIRLSVAEYDENIGAPSLSVKLHNGKITLMPLLPRLIDDSVLYIKSQHAVVVPSVSYSNKHLDIKATLGGYISGYNRSIPVSYSFKKTFRTNPENGSGYCQNIENNGVISGDCNLLLRQGENPLISYRNTGAFMDPMLMSRVDFEHKASLAAGTYVAFSNYAANVEIKEPAIPGLAVIALKKADSNGQKVIACLILNKNRPEEISNQDCIGILDGEVKQKMGEILSLRFHSNMKHVLIADKKLGLSICNIFEAEGNRCKVLGLPQTGLMPSLAIAISRCKPLDSGNCEFWVSYRAFRYQHIGDLWFGYDKLIISNAGELKSRNDIRIPLADLSYLDYDVIEQDRPMVIGKVSETHQYRSGFICSPDAQRFTDCKRIPHSYEINPVKIFQTKQGNDVTTYIIDYYNSIYRFKGVIGNIYQTKLQAGWMNFSPTEVKPDNFNKGVFVVLTPIREDIVDGRLYYIKNDATSLMENQGGQFVKHDSLKYIPTSIEIRNQAVYR